MRGTRDNPKAGFQFSVQKQPVLESGDTFLEKKPHLDTKPDSCQSCIKSTESSSTSTAYFRKKGSCRGHCS